MTEPMLIVGTGATIDIQNSSFIDEPEKSITFGSRSSFYNKNKDLILSVSEDGIILGKSAKEVATYLFRALTDDNHYELRINASIIIFSDALIIFKEETGKYNMKWVNGTANKQFLELQKEFNRLMELIAFI